MQQRFKSGKKCVGKFFQFLTFFLPPANLGFLYIILWIWVYIFGTCAVGGWGGGILAQCYIF